MLKKKLSEIFSVGYQAFRRLTAIKILAGWEVAPNYVSQNQGSVDVINGYWSELR